MTATSSSQFLPTDTGNGTIIGSTYLKRYVLCPRQWFNLYFRPLFTDGGEIGGRGLQPKTSAVPLLTGGIFHEGLAALYLSGCRGGIDTGEWSIDSSIACAEAAWKNARQEFDSEEEAQETLSTTTRMLREYMDRFGPGSHSPDWPEIRVAIDTEGKAIVEREFRLQLNPNYIFTCRSDLLIYHRSYLKTMEHKCLAGDTRVFDTSTGRYFTLQELAETPRDTWLTALWDDGELRWVRNNTPTPTKPRKAIRITTLNGRSITTSLNHPMWTTHGWVETGKLTVGNYLGTPKQLYQSENSKPEFTDAEIKLTGYMIGDGCMTNMQFTKGDKHVIADVVQAATSIGEAVEVKFPSSGRVSYIQFKRGDSPVSNLMRKLNLFGKLSPDKTIPNIAMSQAQVGILLGALWSTDGCIDNFRGKKSRIIYTSRSETLCHQIRDLLQRLGVVARVRSGSVGYKGNRVPVFTTQVVSRESKLRFLELAHLKIIPILRSKVGVAELLRMIPTTTVGPGSDWTLQPAIDPNIWWDKIVSIEDAGTTVLYDVEVPGPHTFVAEGIITHNTSRANYVRTLISSAGHNPQFTGEIACMKAHLPTLVGEGTPLHGVLLNVIVKDRSVKSSFDVAERETTTRTDAQLERWRLQTLNTLQRIDDAVGKFDNCLAEGVDVETAADQCFPTTGTQTDTCKAYGRPCDYYELCQLPGMEQRLMGKYRPRTTEENTQLRERPY